VALVDLFWGRPRVRCRHYALLTDGGIEQFILEDADSIAFVDPELQSKLATALSRLATRRSDGRRRLSLESRGTGRAGRRAVCERTGRAGRPEPLFTVWYHAAILSNCPVRRTKWANFAGLIGRDTGARLRVRGNIVHRILLSQAAANSSASGLPYSAH
jgi:hypothetical protein